MKVGDLNHKTSSAALRNTWSVFKSTEKHYFRYLYWVCLLEPRPKKQSKVDNNQEALLTKPFKQMTLYFKHCS